MDGGTQLFFEDFPPGAVLEFGEYAVTPEEIVAFASAFDPQPFHLDDEAARRTMLGGLAASGWHTCAILMRLVCDAFLNAADMRGMPGVDEVKWIKPVRPGDVLGMRAEVLSARVSQSRPSIGLVQFRFDLRDAAAAPVLSQDCVFMLGRRGHGVAQRRPAPPVTTPLLPFDAPGLIPAWAHMEIGRRIVLGAHGFEASAMTSFARLYDPQPWHLDAQAAQAGPFGALAASGWHVAAAWMSCMVAAQKRSVEAALAKGEKPIEAGPSPGFRHLRWPAPVLAGDTITYDTTPVEKRLTSRPGWGLLRARNSGLNQHGALVFEFESTVFWRAD